MQNDMCHLNCKIVLM